jgi:hypothetical protein
MKRLALFAACGQRERAGSGENAELGIDHHVFSVAKATSSGGDAVGDVKTRSPIRGGSPACRLLDSIGRSVDGGATTYRGSA